MKPETYASIWVITVSPPARGRGLKQSVAAQVVYENGRPPRGGVD